MYDSATSVPTVTVTYTQDSYARIKGNCSGNTRILEITPRTFTCTTTIVNGIPGNESCTSPISGTPYTSGVCTRNLNLPNPNPGPRTQIGSSVGGTGSTGGSYNSLADVAMYYYQTDLRTADLKNCTGAVSPDVCPNNVARTNTDDNTRQHMTTFTLGLGASGRMVYSPSYLTDTSGDYYSVLNGTPANTAAGICRWGADGQACNWPIPGSGMIENIDDLWHAAVDGHGIYFSATSPSSLSRGISDALAAIAARKGTGASAATSTLNPVDGNNYAYVASYTTEKWIGNLESRTIDTVTGQISPSATWCVENVVSGTCAAPGIIKPETVNSSKVYYCVTAGATAGSCTGTGIFNSTTSECKVPVATSCNGTLPGMAEATGAAPENPRHIYTADSTTSATPHLLPFTYTQLQSAGLSSYFTTPYINGLTQWPDIVANGKQTTASGDNLVKYLRGQTTYDSNPSHTITDRLYRFREATMGDALESQPVFMSIPIFNYTDPGYSDFATAQASRPGTIYIGANDGMLHAFSALAEGTVPGGTERWAYIPSMVLPNLWHLADTGYAHTNYVNGSPMVGDICISACDSVSSVWRTILVGGLNGGGRGYYALDVTDPNNPSLLWEFTADPNKPAGYGDTNLGNSFGTPVITARTSSAGTPEWIVLVTSGYNNGSTVNGDGVGHLYVLDAYTGVLREDIKTSAGSPGSPSGLARISAWNDTLNSNRATWVYGGDLEGNIWRFDISVNSPTSGTSTLFANLNIGGKKQPITTPPVLGEVQGKRVIYVATGKYLESTDSGNTDQQSVYAIMDDNATVALSSPRASLVQQTLTDTGTGVRTITSNPVSFSGTNRGWFVDFPEAGERANIESFLLQGALIVASNVPSTTVCSPGGHAWMNAFNYLTGGATDSTGVASTYYSSQLVGINHFYPEGKLVIEGVTSEGDIFVDPNIKLFAPKPGFTDRRWLYRELDPLNP
jgi:type IV pilus assembly protein PilY1